MIIGVTGFSASGKTRFSKALREEINDSVLLLSQDSYYFPKIEGDPNDYNFDSLDALDLKKLNSDIELLKENKAIQLPLYDFVKHKRTGYNKVFPRETIILEGHLIFLKPEIRNLVDILIFIDLRDDLTLVRRLRRDIHSRGRKVEEVINRYERFVQLANNKISTLKEYSDLVVPNYTNMDKAIDVVASYINKRN